MINHFIYIISFSILFQLLTEVNPQTTTLKPDLRYAHTATFINSKIYLLGGAIPNTVNSPKETFFYLDFSAPFNTSELRWTVLLNNPLNNSVIPPHYFAAAIKGGANDDILFLYGGESLSDQTMNLVYTFYTINNSWIPKITDITPTGKMSITPIIDSNALIYLFGGRLDTIYSNEMFVLNTTNLNLKKLSSINAPSPRAEYGAVFLPDHTIIYMGGYNNNAGVFDLNQVYLYDTVNNSWSIAATNGTIPTARSSFSSVLGLDGQRVIIYGGHGNNTTTVTIEESVYVLDINNFSWYIPNISGNIPSSRVFHKSLVIGKYMVVTFGEGYLQEVENNILLLDISNNDEYIWTTSFDPLTNTSSSIPSPQPNISSNNKLAILVSVIIICFISFSVIIARFFILKKRKRKMQKETELFPYMYEISGNNHIQESREETSHPYSRATEINELYLPNVRTLASEEQLRIRSLREEIVQDNLIPTFQYNHQVEFNFDNRIRD